MNPLLEAFDVETTGDREGAGLQPYLARSGAAYVTMCAMASPVTGAVCLRRPDKETLRAWLVDCAARGVTIAGWNTPFDMGWLIAMGLREEVFACKWADAMLWWKHCTAGHPMADGVPKSYGLKDAVRQFMPGMAGYEDGVDYDDLSPEGLDKLATYNKRDAVYTLWLANTFWRMMSPEQRVAARIEAACLPMVAEANVEGLVVDTNAALLLSDKLDQDATLAHVKLSMACGGPVDVEVLASPTKLRDLLFKQWGLKPVKQTEKGADSTDRDSLSQLAFEDPRAGLLNDYREATNNRAKFALGAINSAAYNDDGRVRPAARVSGTYTGRMTYSSSILKGKAQKPTGIALHQWKRDPAFRDIILAPDGHTLIEADWSGQEFRWMAVLSGDREMIARCMPGEDAHAFMGAAISEQNYYRMMEAVREGDKQAKQYRQMGKVGNLSCQYRTSPPTLQRVARVNYGLDLTLPQARSIHATYRSTYPGVPRYWARQIKTARMEGYVTTMAGRRIHTGKGNTWVRTDATDPSGYADWTWAMESTAINAPVQGTGADQKYLGLMALRNWLPKFDGRFAYELHDGVFVVVPDRYAEKAANQIGHLLDNLPYKQAWGVNLPVAFPVDVKMGKSWGSMTAVERS